MVVLATRMIKQKVHDDALRIVMDFFCEDRALCCKGSFSIRLCLCYTIFTPQRHGALWKCMVFCEL